MLGTTHVEVKHRVFHPFFLVIGNRQSFKQFLSPLEIGLKRGGEKRFSESSWATQKNVLHTFDSEIYNIFCLIDI